MYTEQVLRTYVKGQGWQAVKVQLIECIDRGHAQISWRVDNNGTVESYSKYMKATERYEDLMNYYHMIIG